MEEFEIIIKDIVENSEVLKMKEYRQHADTSCFDHCYMASYYCYILCKKFKLDYKSCARAAMLHDFYLYDWRVKDISHKWHAFTHPKKALEKALSIFDLNDREKDIIINHMWPVTIKLPRTKEAFILTLVDKYCATYETVSYTLKRLKKKPSWQYAYLMFWLVIRK